MIDNSAEMVLTRVQAMFMEQSSRVITSKIQSLEQMTRFFQTLSGNKMKEIQLVRLNHFKFLNVFIQIFNNFQINELKRIPDGTHSRNPHHGRVATIMEYIFEPKFIKSSLAWSYMMGFV